MQKVSFRPFIIYSLIAAALLTSGVLFYWRQVTILLEQDVRTHIVDTTNESADDFNRLVTTDREILSTISLAFEDSYPWKDTSFVSEMLARFDQEDHFNLLGIVLNDGRVFYSSLTSHLSASALQEVLKNTAQKGSYLTVRPREDKYASSILVQAVALDPNENQPVGAVFAVQKEEYYKEVLGVFAQENGGNSFIIDRSGRSVLAFDDAKAENIFATLGQVSLDTPRTLEEVRQRVTQGEPLLVGYYTEDGLHHFLQFVPLAVNGWYMVATVPAKHVEEQAAQVAKLSLILFGVVFAVFYLLLFFIMRLREDSNRQLFMTAFVDSLTGADNFNRMCEQFDNKLDDLYHQASLVIFDINKFKVINDLHGYERGNEVLRRVAQVLQRELAPEESFCRLSADNFILLLKYEERPAFLKRLKALATQLKRDCTLEDSRMMLDIAFGIYEITEDIPFYIMLDRAHLALERAKQRTFDKCEFYETADRTRIVTEQQIENSMESALANREFEVFLQPKCDFATGEIRGAEALVRWNHDGHMVRPDEFIPLFERNGFILKLDMFILEEVARVLASWRDNNKPVVPLAVNFSRLHLNDSCFIPQMRRIMAQYNVPTSLVEAEITESVIFNNLERAQEVIGGLHLYGFPVSMDDFGSGYSSLNVLKELKFDSIKLDKEFLAGFEENPRAQKVIEGAISMIKTLGVKVVTEGVETREQAQFLRDCGADLAQGYFFSRPVTVATFEQLLEKKNLG
jgi:diguanylate cyclase (GGDEF)-like protein